MAVPCYNDDNMTNQETVSLKGVYTFTIRDAKTGEIKRTYKYENVVPTVAKTLIANQLCDPTPTNTPVINKVALGTGTNAPAVGDTTLQTETYRNNVASLTNAANIGYATGFFSASETSGTFRECGLFSNGTGSANTGVLISRVAINITKSITETLTVDWQLTIS